MYIILSVSALIFKSQNTDLYIVNRVLGSSHRRNRYFYEPWKSIFTFQTIILFRGRICIIKLI